LNVSTLKGVLDMKSCRNTLLLAVAIFLGIATVAGVAQPVSAPGARIVAGSARPGSVPDGYVITPFGYFHASCVQSLAKGEKMLANRHLQHADGSVDEKAVACEYPHYTRNGARVFAGSASTNASRNNNPSETTPEIDGWLEAASIVTYTQSYGALNANWTVPAQPKADDGQVLFFFPGLEDINNTQSILQPVLQWSHGQWALGSWNCCMSGVVAVSPLVNVSPGDHIQGSITSTCPSGTPSCPTWNVLSVDLSTGGSTTLSDTPSVGQVFNWAFGGVLEPYYVISCDDFPRDRGLTFEKITVFDQNFQPVPNPNWGVSSPIQAVPQCNYNVREKPSRITLSY
jgi:hypothetical protein